MKGASKARKLAPLYLAAFRELYLFAQYASGMAAPSSTPQLVAQLMNSTSQCLHKEAVVISNATAVTDLIAAAKCASTSPLKAGLYNLQAAAVAGAATSASWNCFNNNKPAVSSSSSNATATAAGPAAVALVNSQCVNLEAGSSYTCIALYTPQAPAAAATAAAPTTAVTTVAAAAEVTNGTSLNAAVNATVIGTESATPNATANGILGVLMNTTVNGTASEPLSAANSTAETAATCKPVAYKQPPRGHPAPPLGIRGSQLVNKRTNRPVVIRGLNWFGFNVDMGMVDGLWAGGMDAATDFSKIAYQIRMLGFNAVRLPFVHKSLAKTEVWDLVRNCTNINAKSLKDRLVDPQDANVITLRRELPRSSSLVRNKRSGLCNSYLPMRNNEDLFVVQQFIALGMYVVLDYQPQGLEQHAYNTP